MHLANARGLANFRVRSLKRVGGIIYHRRISHNRVNCHAAALSRIKIMIDRVSWACKPTLACLLCVNDRETLNTLLMFTLLLSRFLSMGGRIETTLVKRERRKLDVSGVELSCWGSTLSFYITPRICAHHFFTGCAIIGGHNIF